MPSFLDDFPFVSGFINFLLQTVALVDVHYEHLLIHKAV